MKCLMIKPEYVDLILGGEKDVEYRSWTTQYRGDFFIGCTATTYSNSFLCCVASLDEITFNEDENIYEWHLSNIRGIKPLPVKGQLRLFECGIDDYEVINDLPEEEIEKIYLDADKWIQKQKGR